MADLLRDIWWVFGLWLLGYVDGIGIANNWPGPITALISLAGVVVLFVIQFRRTIHG